LSDKEPTAACGLFIDLVNEFYEFGQLKLAPVNSAAIIKFAVLFGYGWYCRI